MQRTNIYLDEEQLRALKHLAVEEQQSVALLVRRAVDEFLARQFGERTDWGDRFDALVQRIRSRVPTSLTTDEIEKDVAAARDEVRKAHHSARAAASARSR